MSRVSHDAVVALEIPQTEQEYGILQDFLTLTKARLSLLVVVTTFVGFCLATSGPIEWLRILNATLGTALAAAGAAVLNQFMESHVDRLMERTRHRPLPAGRIKTLTALVLGLSLSVAGIVWLWYKANALSSYLAAATVAIYLLFYTPLKRRTSFCTIVGAISGAIPPMIGWTAARPSLDSGAWILFGVLFTWQMPHFLAIAWMYRDEYSQAGFVMLHHEDVSGCSTAMQSLLFTIGLTGVTLVPYFVGMNSGTYVIGALLLDAGMLYSAGRFLILRHRDSARSLFFTSIIFLPLILGLMVFTKA